MTTVALASLDAEIAGSPALEAPPCPVLTPPAILSPTVGELLRLYAAEYLPSKAPKTCYQQGRMLLAMARDLGALPLEALSPAVLRTYRDSLLARHNPGTVRGYLSVLSGALRVAVEDYEWLTANPLDRVHKPAPAKVRVRFLSDDERHRLLAACRDSTSPALYTVVLLALASGARKMEVLSLRWPDVDLERRVIRLAETKNGQGRVVPIPPLVVTELARWGMTRRLTIDWVFPGVHGTKPMHIGTAWETARKRAGLDNFRFHDLRHTAASYLAMSGASLREIAEVLGHTTTAMAMFYVHLTTGHMAAVIDRMSDRFLTGGAEKECLDARTM